MSEGASARKTRWLELAILCAFVFVPLLAWNAVPIVESIWLDRRTCPLHRKLWWAGNEDKPAIQREIDGIVGFELLRSGANARLDCPECDRLLERRLQAERR